MNRTFFEGLFSFAFTVAAWGCDSEGTAPGGVIQSEPSNSPRTGSNTGNPSCMLAGCSLPVRGEVPNLRFGAYIGLDTWEAPSQSTSARLTGVGTKIDVSSGQCQSSGLVSLEFPWATENAQVLADGSLSVEAGDPTGVLRVISFTVGSETRLAYTARSYHVTISPDGAFEIDAAIAPAPGETDGGHPLMIETQVKIAGTANVACIPEDTELRVSTASGAFAAITCNQWYLPEDGGVRECGNVSAVQPSAGP